MSDCEARPRPSVPRPGCYCEGCQPAREKRLADQRRRRAASANAETRRYEKTPKGFLVRAYRNMKSRVEGIQKPGSWTGKDLLSRDEFYRWALQHPDFHRLFRRYAEAGFEMRLAPSVNRIDSAKGYTLDNMEWVTHGVNSALASRREVRRAA